MKKLFLISLLAMFMVSLVSCEKKKQQQQEPVVSMSELVVEKTVSADREYMFLNYGEDYRWYETCILLNDFLDAEECDGTIAGVSNIFQFIVNQDSTSADIAVLLSAYGYGKHTYEVKEGFWVGDSPMNEDTIKITFKQAFERVMEANYPKPHSRHCVLRREVGPVPDVAPQYIFGNQRAQLYVDAVTGEVKDTNPAFEGYLGKPLGEWP